MARIARYEKNDRMVKVKFVSSPREKLGRDGESSLRTVYVTFPHVVSRREVSFAAREIFDTYCQHSYDCCGHWYCSSLGHEAKQVRPRTWMIFLSYSRNI